MTEEAAMINWVLKQKDGPVAIKLPVRPVPAGGAVLEGYRHIHYQKRRAGKKIAILALGDMQELGSQVQKNLMLPSTILCQLTSWILTAWTT